MKYVYERLAIATIARQAAGLRVVRATREGKVAELATALRDEAACRRELNAANEAVKICAEIKLPTTEKKAS
jgi:hypothetical protein